MWWRIWREENVCSKTGFSRLQNEDKTHQKFRKIDSRVGPRQTEVLQKKCEYCGEKKVFAGVTIIYKKLVLKDNTHRKCEILIPVCVMRKLVVHESWKLK